MNMRELIEKALYSAGLDAEDWTEELYQEYRDICEYTEKPNTADYIAYCIHKAAEAEAFHRNACAAWAPIE